MIHYYSPDDIEYLKNNTNIYRLLSIRTKQLISDIGLGHFKVFGEEGNERSILRDEYIPKLKREYKIPMEKSIEYFLKNNIIVYGELPEDARMFLIDAGVQNCLVRTTHGWGSFTDSFIETKTYRLNPNYINPICKKLDEYEFYEYDIEYKFGIAKIEIENKTYTLNGVQEFETFAGIMYKNPFTGEIFKRWFMTRQFCYKSPKNNEYYMATSAPINSTEYLPAIPIKVRLFHSN